MLAACNLFTNIKVALVLLVLVALAIDATKLTGFELHRPQGVDHFCFGGYLRQKFFNP
jgi:hypothetical protein